MKRLALKKSADISNNPEVKNKKVILLILVEKLRQNISKSICHTAHLLNTCGNSGNHSFQ